MLVSSREQQKQAAREARLAAEQKEAAAARRRRRLGQLGGIVLGAAAVVAVLVAISSKGGSTAPKVPAAQSTSLLAGLPQKGLTLGSAKAPLTLVEFNDMQCPICRDYMSNVFPTLVNKYVRTGKLRMEMRLQSFIGPDSVKGGQGRRRGRAAEPGVDVRRHLLRRSGPGELGLRDAQLRAVDLRCDAGAQPHTARP